MTTRLNSQLDGPDCPDGSAVCSHLHGRSDGLVIGDTDAIVDWQYCDSTTTDDDEEEMVQELPTMDVECELPEEQPVVFKVPEIEAPRKTRKSRKERSTTAKVTRRQRTRACKSATKTYDVQDFSDDAEVN